MIKPRVTIKDNGLQQLGKSLLPYFWEETSSPEGHSWGASLCSAVSVSRAGAATFPEFEPRFKIANALADSPRCPGGEWIEQNIPEEGGGDHRLNLVGGIPTLADVGIDKNDSPKFRILPRCPGGEK